MSQYVTSPFKPPVQLAVAGTPSYLLGSWNDKTGPTQGYVISNSAVTTTGTLTFQIVSGNIPAVGALITVVGCANSTNFNVTNVAILTVTTTLQGVCTVTYTISSTSQATTADAGQVIIPQVETGESVTGTYASVPVARPFNNPNIQEGQSISATVNLLNSGNLSGITIVLQAADIDLDGEYQTIHTFTASGSTNNVYTFQSGTDVQAPSATPGTITNNPGGANLMNYRFYRFKVSGGSGTGPIVGKIEF